MIPSALLKFYPIFRALTPGHQGTEGRPVDKALMRGFLRNLGQEDKDRNTDGRKCHNPKEKEEEGLLAASTTVNSCRLEGLRCY